MNKTKKMFAAVAAIGALAIAGVSFAAPSGAPNPGPRAAAQGPEHAAPLPPEARIAMRYEALERMLTLKDGQQDAYKAYVAARTDFVKRGDPEQKPAVDEQDRLEQRAARLEAKAAAVKKVADTRAALLKTLSPEQKFVLENFEIMHRGHGAHPDFRQFGRGPAQQGPQAGMMAPCPFAAGEAPAPAPKEAPAPKDPKAENDD